MLRKPGICQKPVITLYETPAYAACGTAVGAEPTGVPENGGVADEILFGWQYEVLEENNAFYKIRTHYGYEGWIAAEEYVPWKVRAVQVHAMMHKTPVVPWSFFRFARILQTCWKRNGYRQGVS